MTSIRQKLLLSTALVLVVFCVGVLVLSRKVMLDGYLDLEKQDMQRQLNRVNKAVASYFDVLDTTAFDWAAWDDTYAFVENKNSEFVKTNLVDETFNENGLRLNFMVFLDAKQNIVFQKGYNWEQKKSEPVPQGILGHLTENGLVASGAVKGLLILPEGLFAVVSRPILTRKETGPARGQLIVGRRFDKKEIDQFATSLELNLTLYVMGRSTVPVALKDAYAHVLSDSSHWVKAFDEKIFAGVVALKDIYANPVAMVHVIQPRDIYRQGIVSVRSAFGAILITGVLLAVVFFLMLERFVWEPIKNMRADLQDIDGLRDLSLRVRVRNGDELGELG
ncbi:MAG: CHASE4 domain-containing protein, partial [Candidatus Latescibacterota bacterium]